MSQRCMLWARVPYQVVLFGEEHWTLVDYRSFRSQSIGSIRRAEEHGKASQFYINPTI